MATQVATGDENSFIPAGHHCSQRGLSRRRDWLSYSLPGLIFSRRKITTDNRFPGNGRITILTLQHMPHNLGFISNVLWHGVVILTIHFFMINVRKPYLPPHSHGVNSSLYISDIIRSQRVFQRLSHQRRMTKHSLLVCQFLSGYVQIGIQLPGISRLSLKVLSSSFHTLGGKTRERCGFIGVMFRKGFNYFPNIVHVQPSLVTGATKVDIETTLVDQIAPPGLDLRHHAIHSLSLSLV